MEEIELIRFLRFYKYFTSFAKKNFEIGHPYYNICKIYLNLSKRNSIPFNPPVFAKGYRPNF